MKSYSLETNYQFDKIIRYHPFRCSDSSSGDDIIKTKVDGHDDVDGPDGLFNSSLLSAGKTFEFTFDDVGSYDYFCMVHPWQTGKVIVFE